MGKINNDLSSYECLAKLYEAFKGAHFETINLRLGWFAANMASALGGVLDLLATNLNSIRLASIPPKTEQVLRRNGFLAYFGQHLQPDHYHTSIPFQKLKPTDGRFFNQYVTTQLLSRSELPQMAEQIKAKVSEAIYEIFVNAQIHSESQHIYTCGQFYPNKNKIEFTITDTGVGFQERVNRRFGKKLTAIQSIAWAVQDRHTTKTNISGGIGLALLREFIYVNQGKLQIVSGNGFYQYSVSGELQETLDTAFPGTVVNLQFRTDDSLSPQFPSEADLTNIF